MKRRLWSILLGAILLVSALCLAGCDDSDKVDARNVKNWIMRYSDPLATPNTVQHRFDTIETVVMTYQYDGMDHMPNPDPDVFIGESEDSIRNHGFTIENTSRDYWIEDLQRYTAIHEVKIRGKYKLDYRITEVGGDLGTGFTIFIIIE